MGFGYFEKPQIEPHTSFSPANSHFYRSGALGTAYSCSPVSDLYLSQPIAGSLCGAGAVARRLAGRPQATAAHAAQHRAFANVLYGVG